MTVDLKRLPFADSVPAKVRRVFAQAVLLHEESRVERAVDRVAVRMTVDMQDQNPLLINVLPAGFVFAGMLLRRLVFPLQFVSISLLPSAEVDASQQICESLHQRDVVLVDGQYIPQRSAHLQDWATKAGAASIRKAFLVAPDTLRNDGADYIALVHEGESGDGAELLGCGLDYQGYGANLPGIYAIGGSRS